MTRDGMCIIPGVLNERLFLPGLLVESLVRLLNLDDARGHGVLSRGVLDVGPERPVVVSAGFFSHQQL